MMLSLIKDAPTTEATTEIGTILIDVALPTATPWGDFNHATKLSLAPSVAPTIGSAPA